MTAMLQIAERQARQAHAGQLEELTGDDYIHHVERVVALVEGEDSAPDEPRGADGQHAAKI